MTAAPGNPDLDSQFSDARQWRREAISLRQVLLDSGLSEERKWGKACYTHEGRNLCIIQRMKDFLALLFFNGALLKDPDGLLEVQGPNSRSGYRMRFTSVQEVDGRLENIRSFVRQAIEIEEAGLEVEGSTVPDYPEELVACFDADPGFRTAFESLTAGRQRGYLLHFSGAKQSKTRQTRIDRHRRRILEGLGLHDR